MTATVVHAPKQGIQRYSSVSKIRKIALPNGTAPLARIVLHGPQTWCRATEQVPNPRSQRTVSSTFSIPSKPGGKFVASTASSVHWNWGLDRLDRSNHSRKTATGRPLILKLAKSTGCLRIVEFICVEQWRQEIKTGEKVRRYRDLWLAEPAPAWRSEQGGPLLRPTFTTWERFLYRAPLSLHIAFLPFRRTWYSI